MTPPAASPGSGSPPSPASPPPQISSDDVDLNSIVAYNFRAARTLRGWTQKETGRRLEPLLGRRVLQVHVAQLEGAYRGRRRRKFDAHQLVAFAIAFQLPVVWFLLPPPGDNRRLRNTQAHVDDIYEIVFGGPDQLEPLYQRLRHLAHSDPDVAGSAVDQIAGPGVTAQLPAYRQRRSEMVLALLDSRADRLERAAGEIGAFFDHVRRLGLRSLIAQAERTTDE